MSGHRDAVASLAIVGTVLSLVVARHVHRLVAPRPSPDACQALVDRYIRDKSRERYPNLDESEIERLARSRDRSDDVASCRRDLTAEQVSCGLGASDVASLERCVH